MVSGQLGWTSGAPTRRVNALADYPWGEAVRAIAGPLGWALIVSSALIVGIVPRAFAQDNAPTGAQDNAPTGAQGDAPSGAGEIAPTGEYKEGVPLAGWMLFPSVFLGAVYNSNLSQSAQGTPTEIGFGVRAVPRLVGTYDGGIYKTTGLRGGGR